MRLTIALLTITLALTGCMSDKEYQLRKHQLTNQANHQQTYSPLTISGPASIALQPGSKLEVRSETQPFQQIQIPDGMKAQTEAVQTATGVAAGTFLGYRALRSANGSTSTKVINKGAGK